MYLNNIFNRKRFPIEIDFKETNSFEFHKFSLQNKDVSSDSPFMKFSFDQDFLPDSFKKKTDFNHAEEVNYKSNFFGSSTQIIEEKILSFKKSRLFDKKKCKHTQQFKFIKKNKISQKLKCFKKTQRNKLKLTTTKVIHLKELVNSTKCIVQSLSIK